MAAVIETRNLAAAFADGHAGTVFEAIDLAVATGELVTLVGASGAGKSTLLRIIAGLLKPAAGEFKVNVPSDPARRPFALVFQEARLFPWRTVADNVHLGLEGLELDKRAQKDRVSSALKLVGLADFDARWPYQLSGGQRQRVGIARALAVEPALLLMDEPFGALDAITRQGLQDELLRIWRETGKSILFVTHDIEEAVYLGQRVLLLGGAPARILETFDVTAHSTRRDDPEVLKSVRAIKSALHVSLGGKRKQSLSP